MGLLSINNGAGSTVQYFFTIFTVPVVLTLRALYNYFEGITGEKNSADFRTPFPLPLDPLATDLR